MSRIQNHFLWMAVIGLSIAVLALLWAPSVHGGPRLLFNGVEALQELDLDDVRMPDITFTLTTRNFGAHRVYVGVDGSIDGVVNPILRVRRGDRVQVVLLGSSQAPANIRFPDFDVLSATVSGPDEITTVVFDAKTLGARAYFCTLPGYRSAGLEGRLVVEQAGDVIPTGIPVAMR